MLTYLINTQMNMKILNNVIKLQWHQLSLMFDLVSQLHKQTCDLYVLWRSLTPDILTYSGVISYLVYSNILVDKPEPLECWPQQTQGGTWSRNGQTENTLEIKFAVKICV